MKGQVALMFILMVALDPFTWAQAPTFQSDSPFINTPNVRSACITDLQGKPQFPIISQYGSQLLFQFDLIQDDREWLNYRLIPADMNGNIVELEASEFIQGFYQGEISDAQLAYNTTTDYVHYALTFPNEMMKPTQSGRYWLLFYRNGDYQDPSNQVVAFPLFVSADKMNVTSRLLKSNDVSKIFTHQQIETTVVPNSMNFNDIPRDIRILIFKNYELRSELPPLAPTFITPERWTFQHNDYPGFAGGNEWRVMDIRQIIAPGFHVDFTQPHQDNPEIWIQQDESNAKSKYGWNDMNGITQFSTTLPSAQALDADYLLTHFQYKSRAFEGGKLLLEYCTALGCREEAELTYNANSGCYETAFYLKQGIYNYRYRWQNLYSVEEELKFTEGNFFETQNEYQIILFQKEPLYQKDVILGTYKLRSP